jgi:hypothetical protein
LNSLPYDFISRTKNHHDHFKEPVLSKVPFIPKTSFRMRFGPKTAAEIVEWEVLVLTYTAHDMQPSPATWAMRDRLKRRAKLDALYVLLHGVTGRAGVEYIYSTIPIVEREEMAAHGRTLSRDTCLMSMNALAAGDPDAEVRL